MTENIVFDALFGVYALAGVLYSFAVNRRIQDREKREVEELAQAAAKGHSLEVAAQQLEDLERLKPVVVGFAVTFLLSAWAYDGAWTIAIVAASFYLLVSLFALRSVQLAASSAASITLVLTSFAVWGFVATLFPRSPVHGFGWGRAALYSLVCALPGYRAIEVLSRYRRVLRGGA